jgi:hypothetical protein
MRIPARGSRITQEWPLPTATSDVAPTELGVFRGWRSYKDCAPTELGAIGRSHSYERCRFYGAGRDLRIAWL